MKILYSPCISEEIIRYTFNGEKIIAEIDEEIDEFDFTDMPDGILETFNFRTGESLVETILEHNPILSAKREKGILYVELLNFITEDATKEEKFPNWIEV